ncbi:MAG: hypothetical protein CM1200mP41_38180 [Gammaproteobacteria bacterium]|nr:MAG: hypothetical protein CM1200mP41_38180 [Gammaproteobacteria bacterium]
MAIYELRTYTFQVGKLDQAKTLYIEKGWPALEKYQDKLVGYLVSDVGPLNQLNSPMAFCERRRPALALGHSFR